GWSRRPRAPALDLSVVYEPARVGERLSVEANRPSHLSPIRLSGPYPVRPLKQIRRCLVVDRRPRRAVDQRGRVTATTPRSPGSGELPSTSDRIHATSRGLRLR